MCALIGITNARKAAERAAQGLHAQQHRGDDCAGIATSDGTNLFFEYGDGIVIQALPASKLTQLHGKAAIGHTRYSTVQEKDKESEEVQCRQLNVQPIWGLYNTDPFYLAHNGNLVNYAELKAQLSDIRFRTSMDTEVIVRLLEQAYSQDLIRDLGTALEPIKGTGSILILFNDMMIALRDPSGSHPLVWGHLEEGYVFASETCALQTLGATYGGEVDPGTLMVVQDNVRTVHTFAPARPKRCLFELLYFAHSTSTVFNIPVLPYRQNVGKEMERRYPVPKGDIVVGVPDCGMSYALGFGESGRSGRFSLAVTRHHHCGRTFIQATGDAQQEKARQKYQFSESEIAGKVVVAVDDSIVRLTTAPVFAQQLYGAGATEVHLRIAFPPIRHPCVYGIHMENYDKLAAANFSIKEICAQVGATSLVYADLDLLLELAGGDPASWCTACVTGEYWHKEEKVA